MKEVKKETKKNRFTPIIAAILAAITAVLAFVHGNQYSQYFDGAVMIALGVSAVLWLIFAVTNNKVTVWFSLLGELCAAFGLGLYVTNSLNIWQDTWGNIAQNGVLFGTFNFFGSEGGPVLPAIIILLGLVACSCGIIACFIGKEEKEDEEI